MEIKKEEEINPQFSVKAQQDYELVLLARQGDQKAYAELLKKYRNSVYFMVLKMVRNHDDAEDLTFEAFGKAFKNLDSYVPTNAFNTWLFKIATNNAIDFIRSNKLKNNVSLDKTDIDNESFSLANSTFIADNNDPEEEMMKFQKNNLMRKIVDQLPVDYKEIIKLRYFDEKSYLEISNDLCLPLGTVKARLFRSRELLLGIIKDYNMGKDKI